MLYKSFYSGNADHSTHGESQHQPTCHTRADAAWTDSDLDAQVEQGVLNPELLAGLPLKLVDSCVNFDAAAPGAASS